MLGKQSSAEISPFSPVLGSRVRRDGPVMQIAKEKQKQKLSDSVAVSVSSNKFKMEKCVTVRSHQRVASPPLTLPSIPDPI